MPSQTEMSKQAFEEKLKDQPESLVFSRLADSYRKSGDVQQAITICSEGLKLHPDYITGRIILGRCFLEQENFNDAIKEFSKVCKLDRRNQIAIKMLADIFSKQGMEEKAGDLYNLLLKMDPDNPSIVHLATIFKGSDKESLFEILGIEEEIKVEKAKEDQAEPEEALDEIESEEIDQEVETPDVSSKEAAVTATAEAPELTAEDETAVAVEEEDGVSETAEEDLKGPGLTTEEEAAVSELVGEDIEEPEITAEDDVAIEESLEEELKEIGISAETEHTPEDMAAPEVEDEAAATLEAITEDLEIPDMEAVTEDQAEAVSEEEPALDEILSPEEDILSDTPPTEDIAIQEEPVAEEVEEAVTEPEEISELKEEEFTEELESDEAELDEEIVTIEELADQEAEKEAKPAAVPDRLEVPAGKTDDELPGGDDISARMGSMFGEDVEELGVDISETVVSEAEAPPKKPSVTAAATASKDTATLPEASELSSRIEDMFGSEEEATMAVEEITVPEDVDLLSTGEKESITTEDVLGDIDLTSAPTATIDKDILDKIRESDIDLAEEEEIPEIEDIEPELLGISDEVEAAIDDISDEKETEGTPTEVIDIEDTKTELVEEPSEFEEIPELFDEETFDELVVDQEEKEDITDSMVTEATAVFDRETISKLATAKVDELDEALDTPLRSGIEDTSSVSGQDVFSRLDEMFPTETAETPPEVVTGETKEIVKKPVLKETAPSADLKEEAMGKQTESISMGTVDSEEQLLGEDIESRIDEMFVEDELLEDISIDSIPDEEIEEGVISGDYYTEGGEAAPLEDTAVTTEEKEKMPVGTDTVALNISPAEEMAVVDDEVELSDISIDLIPDEELEKDELTGEFYSETGEAASLEDVKISEDEVLDVSAAGDTDTADFISPEEMEVFEDDSRESDILPDSTPYEDIDIGEETGDFGAGFEETTSLEDSEISLEEIDDQAISSDTVTFDLEAEGEIPSIDDEIMDSDIAIDSIPDEDFEEGEATVEFFTETGETAFNESVMTTEKEAEIPEPEKPILDMPPTGEDVIETIDKIFPEDQLSSDATVETIPEGEISEETTLGDGFYNVSGEEALTAEVDESMLSSLEEEDEMEPMPEDEETFFFDSESSEEEVAAPDKQIATHGKDLPQKAESIPDHVLTPTLADIYFQQDQPQLAVQIYKRLLERDPENEKIEARIKEIEKVIKEKEALIEKTAAEKEKAEKKGTKKKAKGRKKKTKNDKRPLKGVKIKKNIKERIKRARIELEM